ncbi:hypothetical protein BD779DRAFT_1456980 [Infundibulicybe gibba]|nr:hypothetical protein BD779DRAFT_1456980 [Infundibulicybe gibba]
MESDQCALDAGGNLKDASEIQWFHDKDDLTPIIPQPGFTNNACGLKNPIYYFYRIVDHDAQGRPGNAGDKHYQCFHGNKKIMTVTKAMKRLIGNLKSASPSMFQLYTILKERPASEPITQEEIDIASGQDSWQPGKVADYVKKLEATSENIARAFEKQAASAAAPWDQSKFEQLLAEWMVACDQPFEEVDREEFRRLLTYAHHPAPTLHIPHSDAIKRRIMKIGKDTIEGTKEMFSVGYPIPHAP